MIPNNQVVPDSTVGMASGDLDDAIDEAYLKLPFLSKTICTVQAVSNGAKAIWSSMATTKGPDQARERLKTFWTTLGVVSALLVSVTYSATVNPVQTEDPERTGAATASNVLAAASMALSMFVIILAVMFTVYIDMMSKERDIIAFINHHGRHFDEMAIGFMLSMMTLGGSALAGMFVSYQLRDFWVAAGIILVIAALILYVFFRVFAFTFFRSWMRVHSPLAKQALTKSE